MVPLSNSLLWVAAGSVAASVSLLALVGYLLRHRGKSGANWLMATLVLQALWCLTYAVGLFVSEPFWRVALEAVGLVALSWLGPLFLAFALDYTGRSGLVRSLPFAAVLVVPVVTGTLLATPSLHGAVWTDLRVTSVGRLSVLAYSFEPWAVLIVVLSVVCVALAVVLLVEAVLSYGPLYRREAVAVAVSTVPVATGLLLWFFRVGPYPYLNLGPLLSLPHAVLDAYAFASSGMFESNPTTQRAAERSAFEGIPNPILVLDPRGRIVKFNSDAASLFDLDASGALGADVTAATGLEFSLEATGPQSVSVDASERVREFNVLVEPLTDPAGKRVGTTVVFQDVTREREREQRLEVLNRVLRHNLRNEMTVILGFADFIAEHADEKQIREWAETITESGESLSEIGEKAREFDKLRERDPEPRPVDTETFLRGVRAEFEEAYPDATLELAVETDRVAHADPAFLRVALRNLLANAVEHGATNRQRAAEPASDSTNGSSDARHSSADAAEGSGPTVRLSVREASGGRVQFDVSDDGPGIPESEFRPVLQGEESALDHGSGIGLWIVKWSAAAVGAELQFETDGGTTASVVVPTVADERAA